MGQITARMGLDDAAYERGLRRATRSTDVAASRIERSMQRVGGSAAQAQRSLNLAPNLKTGADSLLRFSGVAGLALGGFKLLADGIREATSRSDAFGRSFSTLGTTIRDALADIGRDFRANPLFGDAGGGGLRRAISGASDALSSVRAFLDPSLGDLRSASQREEELTRQFRARTSQRALNLEADQIDGGLRGEVASINARFDAIVARINADNNLSGQERSSEVQRFNEIRERLISAAERRAGIAEARAKVEEEALRLTRSAEAREASAVEARLQGNDEAASRLEAFARADRERAGVLRRNDLGRADSLERQTAFGRADRRLELELAAIQRERQEAEAAAQREQATADALLRQEADRFRVQELRLEGREREADLLDLELDRANTLARIDADRAASEEARVAARQAAESLFDERRARLGETTTPGQSPLVGQSVAGLSRFVFGAQQTPALDEARKQTKVLERIERNTSRPTAAVLVP